MTILFRQVFLVISLFSLKSFAADLNVIELNLFSPSTTVTLPDTNCNFLLDNNSNYSILPKSENKNIFAISSLKINQSSATVIFTCQNGEYVYQLRYINTTPVLRSYNNYGYDQRKNSYGYSLSYAPNSALTQSFQLNDNSYRSLFFQFNHSDQDLTKGYYSNDFQTNYNGNYLDSGLINNSSLRAEIGDGVDARGRFSLYQSSAGLYGYNFTFQQLKYDSDMNPDNTYILNLPFPFLVQLSYTEKADSSKEFNVQKVATLTIKNFQSNNIITYDKLDTPDTGQGIPSSEVQTLTVNNFTNYFFSSFIYQQVTFNDICQTESACNLSNVGTSFNYQDQDIITRVGYNPIPNQTFLNFQRFFWKNSDVVLNYNKTYSPIASLQDSSLTKSTSQGSPNQLSSFLDARFLKGDWLYTFTLPLVFVNINSSANMNIQYNSQSIGAFCNYQIMPTNSQDWSNVTWNFSMGLNYYPNYGLKQAINIARNHKIYGVVLSNVLTRVFEMS